MKIPPLHTLGELAVRLGAQAHQLRRLAQRGKVPFQKIGRLHIFAESDIPEIRKALSEAGFIRTPIAGAASA